MKIKSVRQIKCHVVETDGKEEKDYTRYGPDSWAVRMGQSDECVNDCSELEREFQAFIASNGEDGNS